MTSDSEETEVVEESTTEEEKKSDTNKNKKNKKSKKNTPEPAENIRVTLPYKPKGEMFAVAETFQGKGPGGSFPAIGLINAVDTMGTLKAWTWDETYPKRKMNLHRR